MNSIDRTNAITGKLGLFRLRGQPLTHALLDVIDEAARFNSRVTHWSCGCGGCAIDKITCNYVGARLARLERHVLSLRGKKTTRGWRTRARYFFWLGAEADSIPTVTPLIITLGSTAQ